MIDQSRKAITLFVAASVIALVGASGIFAAKGASQSAGSLIAAGFSQHLVWRNIGPAKIGGAVFDIAGARVQTPYGAILRIYAAGPGGLFESEDEGAKWNPLLTDYSGSAAVRSVSVSPKNPQELWIGTGDPTAYFRESPGDGVYRSLDSGKNWERMGFADSPYIGFVRVAPDDAGTVYVGAIGDMRYPSAKKGLYRSTDDGQTWQNILHVNDWTGPIGISFDPTDSKTMYVAMQQLASDRLVFLDYGPGAGIYKTTDGGTTWQHINFHLPAGFVVARSAVAIAPSQPNRVYAVIDSRPMASSGDFTGSKKEETWLYRSDDSGANWKRLVNVSREESWTDWGRMFVDPKNPDRMYILSAALLVSDDGGKTLLGGKNAHHVDLEGPSFRNYGVDVHSAWIDPDNSAHVLIGDDHGVYISYNAAKSWRHVDNLTMGRVYGIGLGWTLPFTPVVVALQDSYNFEGPVISNGIAGITNEDWRELYVGSETGNGGVDPSNPNIFYGIDGGAEWQLVDRHDLRFGDHQDLGPVAPLGKGDTPEFLGHGRLGTLLIMRTPRIAFYIGTTRVFRSVDHGAHWKEISPTFAHIDSRPDHIEGRTTRDGALLWRGPFGAEDAVITTIAQSPSSEKIIYAGTRGGIVEVTRDAGVHWNRMPLPANLHNAEVTKIVASSFDPARVYVSATNFFDSDLRPYVLESNDYGSHWRSIGPTDMPGSVVWSLVENPHRSGMLMAGTERGVIGTVDDGANWFKLGAGLPNVRVVDMAFQPQSQNLVIGTWGSGVWVLDDLAPFARAVNPGCPAAFEVPPAFEYYMKNWTHYEAPVYAAPNPPFGAQISYYLPAPDRKGTVRIRIISADGTVVRQFSQPYRAGLNTIAWDLHPNPLYARIIAPTTTRVLMTSYQGPFVLPGSYRVSIAVPGASNCTAAVEAPISVALANPSLLRTFINSYPQRMSAFNLQRDAAQLNSAATAFSDYVAQMKKLAASRKDESLRQHAHEAQQAAARVTETVDLIDSFVQRLRSPLDATYEWLEGSFRGLTPGDAAVLAQAIQENNTARREFTALVEKEEAFSQTLDPQARAALAKVRSLLNVSS